MSLSDLASLGSFVSGVAVLVTLAFLFFQIRQTEKNQRAILNQGAISRATDTAMWMSQHDRSALINRVNLNETNFSNEELWELGGLFRLVVLNLQDAYVQHKQRLVDQATLEQARRGCEFWLRSPVMRALYKVFRENIATDTQLYLDELIDSLPDPKPFDLSAALQVQLEHRVGT